jgi:prephenate dehydratase
MIPVDNTLAGRVADVHHLIPGGELYIIGEHFQLIRHCLLGLPGATIEDITDVHTHIHAISQCRNIIQELNVTSHNCGDTAKGAADIKKLNDVSQAAIASELSADIYNLQILKRDIQDASHNTTRFLILSRDNYIPAYRPDTKFITSVVFDVKNIPAALYKALGGFATNNVQMLKLESYVDKHFQVARFYLDLEGHIEEKALQLAFEELKFFSKHVVMLGTYVAHPFRETKN